MSPTGRKLDPDWQYTTPDADDPKYHTRCSLCSERLGKQIARVKAHLAKCEVNI
jgi:hypothetical protein